jgi:hypothetical protein
MTPEQAAKLREPFPAESIGYLPKAGVKLAYVGHAAVTDRLLQVDPEWTWEPVATHPETGAPLCTDNGLWIKMTVCGVTRYGWGDGPDIKQRISDAIRNAAMRFGVALDLWSKEDLHADGEASPPSSNGEGVAPARAPSPPPTSGAEDGREPQSGRSAAPSPDEIDAMKPPQLMKTLRDLGVQPEGTTEDWRKQLRELVNQ